MPRADRRSRADMYLEWAKRYDAGGALERLCDRERAADLHRSIGKALGAFGLAGSSVEQAAERAVLSAISSWYWATLDFEEQQELEDGRGERDALADEALALARSVRAFADHLAAHHGRKLGACKDLIRAERVPREERHLLDMAVFFGTRLEVFAEVERPAGRPDYHSMRFRTSTRGWWEEATGRQVDRAPPDLLVEVALELWRFMGWPVTARSIDELGWMRGRLLADLEQTAP